MRAFNMTAAVIIAMLVLAPLVGCGGEPVKPSEENVKATAALGVLEEMRGAYVERDMHGVLDHVSPGLENGYADFSARVRKDVEYYGRVELSLTVERVELAEGEARVVFHWNGKWWDAADNMVEGRGNAVFHFSDEGKMPLKKFVGDSPFGVVR